MPTTAVMMARISATALMGSYLSSDFIAQILTTRQGLSEFTNQGIALCVGICDEA